MFICPICHNKDLKYIGYKNGNPYCRKCILLARGRHAESRTFFHYKEVKANINYGLTPTQQKASDEILNYVKSGKSCIVNAVCGAGKTELVYQSIEYFVNKGKKVGFTIPRRDVVKEIYARLKKDYPKLSMSAVYGSHTDNLDGQLVVLTTHQLFRYKGYFDLLILDEADAFPYYNNEFLEVFLHESCKGIIVYLSATIKDSFLKECSNVVYVNRRFHNHDLPIPIYKQYFIFNKIKVLNEIINLLKNKPILIFVPTIEIGKELSNKTGYHLAYSNIKNKDQIIDDFKRQKYKILISTSILERGITIKGCQVIVYEANHELFDKSSLIQISGRVGRKMSDPTGNVFFLATNKSEPMKKCIEEIKRKNESKE